jgi:DNA repair protein RadC
LSGTERMAATKTKSKGIVSWPQEERPRERLLSRGAQALTDAELVAILVRVGFKGTSAVELGRQLLKRFGSLRAMVEAPVIALLEVKGLKGAKAAQLLAAMEIARRVAVPAQRRELVIKSTTGASEYLRERMCGLSEEQFRVLYLNRRHALLEDALIAQGSVESVHPPLRTIVKGSPGQCIGTDCRSQSPFRSRRGERVGPSADSGPYHCHTSIGIEAAGSCDCRRRDHL